MGPSRPVTRRRIKLVRIEGAEGLLIFQEDGAHLGPVSAEILARAIATGTVPADAYATVAGASHWRRVIDIPSVRAALDALQWEEATPKR